MEGIVTWWCHLIGITSAPAIQTAVGVVGAFTLILVAALVLALGLAINAWVSR